MNAAILWHIAPCAHMLADVSEECIIPNFYVANCCTFVYYSTELFYPEDGGNTFLRNAGSHIDYTGLSGGAKMEQLLQ
jgi:hypothetical protein